MEELNSLQVHDRTYREIETVIYQEHVLFFASEEDPGVGYYLIHSPSDIIRKLLRLAYCIY